ncbi:MAG: transporter substrate-binding domain-containing protein [Bacteroidaceae bacterium]|nr:transporter substrate-binding domain-containing protein [Bacteroidaceae bacterium]
MKYTSIIHTIIGITIAATCIAMCSCGNSQSGKQHNNDLDTIIAQGELRVLTISGSTSYFFYKGEEMGYEYEVIKRFADDMGLKLQVIVAHNVAQLTKMLNDSVGDIIAYDIPIIDNAQDEVMHCGPLSITEQVLVQRNENPIADVVELVGKDVYVEKDSKYEKRLINLNKELGGGINIHYIEPDTITTEDLIEKVAQGEIDYTLADGNLARINSTYYNNLDIYIKVSFPQRSQWAVRKHSTQLAQAINQWTSEHYESEEIKAINKRYFESSKRMEQHAILSITEGRISPFDEIFKQEAQAINWDWRLLAAMAYIESRFDTTVVSWMGARGLMQLMPKTAEIFGLGMDSIDMPQPNIRAAVQSLSSIENNLVSVEDRAEKLKFTIAAYNSGLGHVFDAIAIAKKYDKNPQVWYNEVEEAMNMKANPEYYNDEVCRFGYFRGRQTTTYVRDVMSLYNYYCKKIPQ